jgi:hypothetical protein
MKTLTFFFATSLGLCFANFDGAALERTRYFLPREPVSTPNVKSNLSALASVLYYILSGNEPYHIVPESEVTALYSQGLFPDVNEMSCGELTKRCWTVITGYFTRAHEVVLGCADIIMEN